MGGLLQNRSNSLRSWVRGPSGSHDPLGVLALTRQWFHQKLLPACQAAFGLRLAAHVRYIEEEGMARTYTSILVCSPVHSV